MPQDDRRARKDIDRLEQLLDRKKSVENNLQQFVREGGKMALRQKQEVLRLMDQAANRSSESRRFPRKDPSGSPSRRSPTQRANTPPGQRGQSPASSRLRASNPSASRKGISTAP